MKKKLAIGLLTVGVLLGSGTAVFAAANGPGQGTFSFSQMLPFMKQMHPNLNEQQLKDMYNTCNGAGGAATGQSFHQQMMQNYTQE